MDERIIDRKLFIDLANEVGLNASHIEAMGEMRHCEITVSGNMLERLVEIQHQFEQLTVMGMMNTVASTLWYRDPLQRNGVMSRN